MNLTMLYTNIPSGFIQRQYHALQSLQDVGGNSGNVVFWEAALKLMREVAADIRSLTPSSKPQAEDRCILVLANSIQDAGSNYLHYLMNIMGQAPYMILSIGAQSADFSAKSMTLGEVARRAVKRAIERAQHVFLRGQHSLAVLQHNKIDTGNCRVLGCPSITNLAPQWNFRRMLQVPSLSKSSRMCIALPNNHQVSAFNLHWLQSLFLAAGQESKDVYFLVQDGFKDLCIPGAQHVYFANPHELRRFMLTMDVCIGTRIHGAIASIQAAVPTLCFPIDSRVRELCATVGVPTLEVEDARQFAEQRGSTLSSLNTLHALFRHWYPPRHQIVNHQELSGRNTQMYLQTLRSFLSPPCGQGPGSMKSMGVVDVAERE